MKRGRGHGFAFPLGHLLGPIVAAVKRHVGVEPEINPATVRIRPLHLRPVVCVLKNAAEPAGIGPDLTRVRGDLAAAAVAMDLEFRSAGSESSRPGTGAKDSVARRQALRHCWCARYQPLPRGAMDQSPIIGATSVGVRAAGC